MNEQDNVLKVKESQQERIKRLIVLELPYGRELNTRALMQVNLFFKERMPNERFLSEMMKRYLFSVYHFAEWNIQRER